MLPIGYRWKSSALFVEFGLPMASPNIGEARLTAIRYCGRFRHDHQLPDFRPFFVSYVSDRVLHCYRFRDATCGRA
jgi:hypothetical protein